MKSIDKHASRATGTRLVLVGVPETCARKSQVETLPGVPDWGTGVVVSVVGVAVSGNAKR